MWGAALAGGNGKLHAAGGASPAIPGFSAFGMTAIQSVNRYDPATDRWAGAGWLGVARYLAGAAALGADLYVVGGAATSSPYSPAALAANETAAAR